MSRYSRYTGGPDPLAPPIDLREALEQIGQDVMEGSSPRRALHEVMRRGTGAPPGADKLAAEANRKRRELLQQHNLDGTLPDIEELLDEAVLAKRKELARALDDDAQFGELQMESLSPSPAKAVQELADYGGAHREAKRKVRADQGSAGPRDARSTLRRHERGVENATDEDRQRSTRCSTTSTACSTNTPKARTPTQDFKNFMAKHGEYFPENPSNVDELLDSLAKRAAAAQRFRNGLSADQRAELDALAQQAFGSPSLMNALDRLDGHLQAARPGEDWEGSSRFSGGDPMGMGEGPRRWPTSPSSEQLAEALSQSYAGATMEDVDLEMLARQLGRRRCGRRRNTG